MGRQIVGVTPKSSVPTSAPQLKRSVGEQQQRAETFLCLARLSALVMIVSA